MIKLAVMGAAGRMGKTLIDVIVRHSDVCLAAAVERPGAESVGRDAGSLAGVGELGIKVVDNLAAVINDIDVIVDFTTPATSIANLQVCAAHGKAAVLGTTGFDEAQWSRIRQLARDITVVAAPNYSVGVNATFKLLEVAARIFGDDVDVEIIEAHHSQKVDAPSGTALRMGEVIAAELGRDLGEVASHGREGQTGVRDRQTIGFSAVRGGDIVGEHTAMFAGVGERLEITHRAQSRTNFADGALRAARWVGDQPNGLYDMQDVLGLRQLSLQS